MKNNLFIWQFSGATGICILGTLLHFLYSFTKITFFGAFSSVNESTFEHMKILFFPMLIFAIIEYFFIGKNIANFWQVKLKGIYLGVLLIPILFYTLLGSFGKVSAASNIAIFFFSAFYACFYEYNNFNGEITAPKGKIACFLALLITGVAFCLFTFYPPKIPLFLDPVTKSYGIV